jgi:CheY-like chemotaxis protein
VRKALATILICDDEVPLRRLVAATLDGLGHTLLEADDGGRALDEIRARRPDLVVLDVMMPSYSGLEVLAEMRADPALAETKVVVLTARAQLSDREAALAAGADLFIAKPFHPHELADAVQRLLAT